MNVPVLRQGRLSLYLVAMQFGLCFKYFQTIKSISSRLNLPLMLPLAHQLAQVSLLFLATQFSHLVGPFVAVHKWLFWRVCWTVTWNPSTLDHHWALSLPRHGVWHNLELLVHKTPRAWLVSKRDHHLPPPSLSLYIYEPHLFAFQTPP